MRQLKYISNNVYITLFLLMMSCSVFADEPTSHAVALLFHQVVADDAPVKSTQIRVSDFKKLLAYIQEDKYRVRPLDQVVTALKQGKPIADKTLVITFDDAYKSIYKYAFPALKKAKFPFTIFISTKAVNSNYGDFLSWSALAEMGHHGALLANHGHSHLHMDDVSAYSSKKVWLQAMRKNIEKAQELIRTKTGQNNKLFAWPYGESTPKLRSELKEMGYVGFGQQSGVLSLYAEFTQLPRFSASGRFSKIGALSYKLNALPLPVVNVSIKQPSVGKTESRTQLTLNLDPSQHKYQKKSLRCYDGHSGQAISLDWVSNYSFTIREKKALRRGRNRYNCTAPTMKGSRYLWFSHKQGDSVNG